MKILRSDRGGEYTSNLFRSFCRAHEINHQLTMIYTPQQNGVAERKNRTILDMARSMVKAKHLPRTFWAEAVLCAVYLLNRCPIKSVRNKLQMNHGAGANHQLDISEFLGVLLMPIFPIRKERSWMTMAKSVFLPDMTKEARRTDSTIP